MDEFEGLLFIDPGKFTTGIHCPAVGQQLEEIREKLVNPQEINNVSVSAVCSIDD